MLPPLLPGTDVAVVSSTVVVVVDETQDSRLPALRYDVNLCMCVYATD